MSVLYKRSTSGFEAYVKFDLSPPLLLKGFKVFLSDRKIVNRINLNLFAHGGKDLTAKHSDLGIQVLGCSCPYF